MDPDEDYSDDEEKEEEEKREFALWVIGFEFMRQLAVRAFKLPVTDDSRIYQLNCKYCVLILTTFAIVVTIRTFSGKTIKCWCPAEFESFQTDYVDSYCFVSNTYYVPFEGPIPEKIQEREDDNIEYYQWVPIILVMQAFLFYMPRFIWKNCCAYSGINIKKAIAISDEAAYSEMQVQREKVQELASYMNKWICIRDGVLSKRSYKRGIILHRTLQNMGFHRGNLLIFLFLLTGGLYVANSVLQILLLDVVLKIDFRTVGVEYFKTVIRNEKWKAMASFPRITFCDLLIRQMSNVQRWTVQCSLPHNMVNEKIFLVVWFMLVLIALVNSLYIIYNIFTFFMTSWKYDFIKKNLTLVDPDAYLDKSLMKQFVDRYLRYDGVFVLWLISHNSNHVVAMDIVDELWKTYQENYESKIL